MRTHLAIFFADRDDVAVLKTHLISDKIAQPDGLALLASRSNKRRKSRERAHLANLIADIWHARYPSAILYADHGDRRKSQSLQRAHEAIFADRGDRRIKSPSVSLA